MKRPLGIYQIKTENLLRNPKRKAGYMVVVKRQDHICNQARFVPWLIQRRIKATPSTKIRNQLGYMRNMRFEKGLIVC